MLYAKLFYTVHILYLYQRVYLKQRVSNDSVRSPMSHMPTRFHVATSIVEIWNVLEIITFWKEIRRCI